MTKNQKAEEYGKCVHCEKSMTKLEAEQSKQGNEDWDELTCDKCWFKSASPTESELEEMFA